MKKSTLLALAVFVALAAGVFAVTRRAPERGISRVSFAQVKAADVDRLEVSGPNPVKLRRDGGVWKLEDGKEADAAAVERALEALPKIVSSDLVTRSSERFAELEVDEAKGTRVEAMRGDTKLVEVVLGKGMSGGAAVRVGDEVYNVKGIFPGAFSKPVASWTERRFFKRPAAEVDRLEVKLAGQVPYVLVKADDGKWKLEDEKALPAGMKFDAMAAASLVNATAALRAKEIADAAASGDTKLGNDADALVLRFKAVEAKVADPANPASKAEDAKPMETLTLRLGATRESDKSVFAKVEGRDVLYVVADGTAKSLRKPVAELRDTSLMSFDAAKVQQLTVVDGANKTVFGKKDGAWTIVSTTEKKPDDFELDPGQVERRLSALATAKGIKAAEGVTPAQAGVVSPSARVAVRLDGGGEVALAFGKTTKIDDREIVFARGNTGDEVWHVLPYTKSNLAGGLANFKRQEAAPSPDALSNLDPSQLQGLPPEVRAGLMKQIEQKKREQELIQRTQAKGK